MFMILPPSEGKNTGQTGKVCLESLSRPQLNPWRKRAADALICASAQPDALQTLKVGASLAGSVAANCDLWDRPVAEAREIYSGVLYRAAHLDDPTLDTAKLAAHVGIVSAVWGLVSPLDRIAAYRCSMGVALPDVGALAKFWQPALREVVLADDDKIVLDCCSAAYQKAWWPAAKDLRAEKIASVVVLKKGKVVSHWAKHTRGQVVGSLLRCGEDLEGIENLSELRELVAELYVGQAEVALGRKKSAGAHQLIIDFD